MDFAMGTRPSIYVDVDDVLADTTAALLALARDLFAKDVAYEDCHSFDLGESFGLSVHERDRLLDAAHTDPVIEAMAPVDGASRALAAWSRRGYRVEIVTGRPPETLAATRRWLRREGMAHDVLASVDKYGRQGHLAEAVPLERLSSRRYLVAVEDSLAMARFLVEEVDTTVLLLDRPWNRRVEEVGEDTRRRIHRVSSWAEIEARVAAASSSAR